MGYAHQACKREGRVTPVERNAETWNDLYKKSIVLGQTVDLYLKPVQLLHRRIKPCDYP